MNRDLERRILYKILRDNTAQFTNEEIKKMASLMEEGIFEASEECVKNMHFMSSSLFDSTYNAKCYEIKMNLDPKSSVNKIPNNLINKIYNNLAEARIMNAINNIPNRQNQLYLISLFSKAIKISKYPEIIHPAQCAKLSPQELHPTIYKNILADIEIKKQQKVESKTTSMYTCENCGCNDAETRSVETCSADEGATLFIECKKCGFVQRDYS